MGGTLTGMLRKTPVPLTAYLDDGRPEAVYDNPDWPQGLRPPSSRSVGFVHQGSQTHALRLPALHPFCIRYLQPGE